MNGDRMKLLIDSKDLEALLEKRKNLFRNEEMIGGLVSSAGLFISAVTGTFPDMIFPPGIFKLILEIISAAAVAYYISKLFIRYTRNDLMREIEGLNMIERASSIVAVKNTKSPGKFLLYNDKGWGVKFFLNYANYKNNTEDDIKRRLSEQIGVSASDISLEFKGHGNEEKASTEHNNEMRRYSYDVYYASIKDFNHENEESFELGGKSYYWMTTDEMLEDENIKKHNDYLVRLVRDNA